MTTEINVFCITCRKTIARDGGVWQLKEELFYMIKDGKDKGKKLSFESSKKVRKCMREGHDVVWEHI